MDKDYHRALQLVVTQRRTGVAFLKHQLLLSESKIHRLLKEMEREGVVSKVGPGGARDILKPAPATRPSSPTVNHPAAA